MQFNLADAVNLLSRTPVVLREMLLGIPDAWATQNEGPETWSPFDVVGHLIHGEETDWIPRAKHILEVGESQPFAAFDRFAQFEASQGKTLEELLSRFAELRAESLRTLKELDLQPADLAKTGTHPAFGKVTLEQLLATWVTHDQTHVVQISRTLARQYQEAVGPWRAYLSVLK